MRLPALLLSGCMGALVGGCDREGAPLARTTADSARADSSERARQDSVNRTLPGYIVDSIFPVQEELRRFRQAIGGTSVAAFSGGSSSREALVRRFVTAVTARDTADLRAMVVRVREFADLYYMDSPSSRPPYKQSPGLAWSMIQNPSLEGLTKLLRHLGGRPLTYVGHSCDQEVVREGRTTRHVGCVVTTSERAGALLKSRLFGSIVERDGQFKFLSYTNEF